LSFGKTFLLKFGKTFGKTLSNYVHFLPSCHPLAQTQIQHIFAAFLSYTQSKKLLIFSELRYDSIKRKKSAHRC
jgi:hypothetical protein